MAVSVRETEAGGRARLVALSFKNDLRLKNLDCEALGCLDSIYLLAMMGTSE